MKVALVVLFAALAVAAAVPLEAAKEEPSPADNEVTGKDEDTLLDKLNSRCTRRDTSACFMLKLVSYMNRLLKKADIAMTESLEITQTSEVVRSSSMGRGLAGSDEEAVGELVASKLWDLARSRALRWKVLPTMELVMSASEVSDGRLEFDLSLRQPPTETGRGKMKNMGPLLAAGAMKIGMVGILAFKALALLVGKALLVAKLAFLLAAIIGLKKLFSQQRHVTYEVVAHPHHSHSHVSSDHGHGGDSYSSGWGRALDVAPVPMGDGQELAYSAHTS